MREFGRAYSAALPLLYAGLRCRVLFPPDLERNYP